VAHSKVGEQKSRSRETKKCRWPHRQTLGTSSISHFPSEHT